MKDKEVEMTLSMLKNAINSVEAKNQTIDSIRVGYILSESIVSYTISRLSYCQPYNGDLKTIYGIPIRVDYNNPWVLKVLTAVDVPVMRESEVSENEYDGESDKRNDI